MLKTTVVELFLLKNSNSTNDRYLIFSLSHSLIKLTPIHYINPHSPFNPNRKNLSPSLRKAKPFEFWILEEFCEKMALRSLDNALPITPERPKKQAKTIISAQKENQFDVNDENRPPQPDATIDYIPSEKLEPFQDPASKIQVFVDFYWTPFLDLMNSWCLFEFGKKIQGLVGGLESKDWLKVCESLNDVRRFALFHLSLLQPILWVSVPLCNPNFDIF